MSKKYDFSGYATRNDLRCSDGRTIRRDAFKDNDGKIVPLVWNHQHNEPANVLGHALLENREDGVYAYCSLNDGPAAQEVKTMVKHGDVNSLSIYANRLQQRGGDVLHGLIREVSVVLAGANPGAFIDSVMAHADGMASEDEAYIYSGEGIALHHSEEVSQEEEVIEHACGGSDDKKKKELEHAKEETALEADKENKSMAENKEKTVKDVFDELTEEQKKVVYFMIGQAIEDAKGGNKEEKEDMKHNVFENDYEGDVLTHADMEEIFSDAKRYGSLKDAALQHGITNIEYLFPDAKAMQDAPDFIKRESEWVKVVMNGTHHTPFSRIKSIHANITMDEARARGYIKGNQKVEEVFPVLKRTTTPTTIYKKQKLDRDDVVDITDFDVVAWLKTEMRGMLDEEIARAILIGDGRVAGTDDKINEDCIRPIWTDNDLYTIKFPVTVAANATDDVRAKAFIRAAKKSRTQYKGSGNPILFTTEDMLTDMLLIEDGIGHILYDSVAKLENALRVSKIVTVPVMEGQTRTVGSVVRTLGGIIVNLADYNVGADKGGAVNMFDDFDIDYNQQKYLIETRCSGAMIKPYSAIALEIVTGNPLTLTVEPEAPTATVLGKTVSTVQSNVQVLDNMITGALKYISNWTEYSATDNSGNFLVLKFAATAGATTTVNLLGSGHDPVTLDSDMNAVFRITNKETQVIKVVETKDGCAPIEKFYSLVGLRCANA